jgi:hypothetical protein
MALQQKLNVDQVVEAIALMNQADIQELRRRLPPVLNKYRALHEPTEEARSGLWQQIKDQLAEDTPGLLDDDQALDVKARQLIEAEYLREAARYRRVDLALTREYGMSFDDFLARRITRERGYTWEVEQDAMNWETAVGGMATVERKLRELRETSNE